MSELLQLLASNAMGAVTGYLIARFSRPTLAPTLPRIEPPLVTPLVLFPKQMSNHDAARWLRRMAGRLEASEVAP
ncbi:hypothetical protein ACT3TC_15070 [Halomonas sp. AOP27-A1-41]|uniref:hypothetical protein n=1 Tax=Halomonas sp. AOP27-A1-41 TaxID=3457707 RepID=UPI0040338ECC